MYMRWVYSQRILVGSLMIATVAVGVLTLLVIRQQQGQADSQIYFETGGIVSAKPVVPVIGRPTMVGRNVGSAGAPIQATAGTEDKGGSQVRCACDSPAPATTMQVKVQPIHRGTPKPSFRSQRLVVHHWDPPAQPHASGPLYQPSLPDAGPAPDEMQRPEKIGPSGEVERPDRVGPSGPPNPQKGS
jgi:hypothetical protein